ncbi:glycosyltransferase [Roseicyclus elongatus]|uniref:glycosyltransferase n=1 Tax=Roseicyclus elongatus TaxID=159346 RepID=UPI0012EB10B6|nr:glycosyltransferase [Roseibacterium elongatum]
MRDGLAYPITPGATVHTKLAVVFTPGLLKEPVTDLTGLRADKVVLVHDRAPNIEQMGLWLSFNVGPMSWAPTNRWVRAKLEELGFPIEIEEEDWRSIGRAVRPAYDDSPAARTTVIGRVSAPGAAQWPATAKEIAATYPTDATTDFRVIGPPPSTAVAKSNVTKHWSVLDVSDTTIERFIEALDVFLYFPGAATPEFPEAAIATAMATGKLVVLPPHLEPHFGPGALYCEAESAPTEVERLLADEDALDDLRARAKSNVALLFGEDTYLRRIFRLAGPPAARTQRKPSPVDPPRILFIPSNGVGLGHAARLLAIARRMDQDIEPIFLSFGKATEILESFGYTTEYCPSYTDIGAEIPDWDAWLRYELGDVVERHNPAAIVYDGNNPTPGLVHAALSRGDCRLAWVRRGMCPAQPSPYLGNSRFFDCIIEPGELASAYDTGPTALRRHETTAVAPIRLLDKDELLSRENARAKLGLEGNAPAVLVQLGAGANRDILDLTDRIVTELQKVAGLQIVIAEWTNTAVRMPHWPGTRLLRGFPISQVFNAFDFSISAAGYNTYHEVLAFGLPTIFVANRHPSMDDQGARAGFAQDSGVGFDLWEEEMHLFPSLVEAMLNEKANAFLRENCAAFDGTNGADEAARILKKLVMGP